MRDEMLSKLNELYLGKSKIRNLKCHLKVSLQLRLLLQNNLIYVKWKDSIISTCQYFLMFDYYKSDFYKSLIYNLIPRFLSIYLSFIKNSCFNFIFFYKNCTCEISDTE